MKYIQRMLMLAVFATPGMFGCKYAKYERVRCQENSVTLAVMICIGPTSISFDRKVILRWGFQWISPSCCTRNRSRRFDRYCM